MLTQQQQREVQERFGLHNGQFFAFYRYKNLQWYIDDEVFGFGDLTDDHILIIESHLLPNETFIGYNEHHGTERQQTPYPMLIIRRGEIEFREDILARMRK